jgi:hypothetical protein
VPAAGDRIASRDPVISSELGTNEPTGVGGRGLRERTRSTAPAVSSAGVHFVMGSAGVTSGSAPSAPPTIFFPLISHSIVRLASIVPRQFLSYAVTSQVLVRLATRGLVSCHQQVRIYLPLWEHRRVYRRNRRVISGIGKGTPGGESRIFVMGRSPTEPNNGSPRGGDSHGYGRTDMRCPGLRGKPWT